MATATTQNTTEAIAGSIERVTYHNEENGFCVLRVKVRGRRDLATVTGRAAKVSAGEFLQGKGEWINDKKHGMQFRAKEILIQQPTSKEGIQKYLASGMVKGIGPHFAKKLVAAFGEDVFDVIENHPQQLLTLEGIGKKRLDSVLAAWDEQKAIRDIMVFLQGHGVGTNRAVRIYKTYGDDAVAIVSKNPYQLADDILGIGFKTADQLAANLGFAKDSIERAEAGVRYVLQKLCEKGHCAAQINKLLEECVKLLEIEEDIIRDGMQREVSDRTLIIENIVDEPCVFLAHLHHAETNVASILQNLQRGTIPWGEIATDKAIPWVEEKTNIKLSKSQKQAVTTVLQEKVAIVTGGPGVGKTTIVNSILKIIRAKRMRISLCAPTGRAAKRMTESTGMLAKTVHRLLEFDPAKYKFKYNQDKPLQTDLLIIDEASMLDINLTYHLLKAVPATAAVIFVGDVDQLPSVGPGAVLQNLIESTTIPTVRLTEIFRQAAHSQIIVNAHRINQGFMPLKNQTDGDFFTIYLDEAEDIQTKLLNMVCDRIPKHTGCNPIRDIQVLAPMHRGGLGTAALNTALQARLNGDSLPKVARFGYSYAPNDKVIQNVNNYDKDVFNGDIGVIARIDSENQQVFIQFEDRFVDYQYHELDEISLAYATSIHKSQGSEYPIVVMPIATQHFTLLARNLLYTGVTRGKQMVVLIGQKKAVGMAIHNHQANSRLTKLVERLREATQ